MDFIACLRHPNQKIQFLYLSSEYTEILCENCLEEGVINTEQFRITKLFSINTLLQKPEILLSKLDMGSNLQNIFQSNLNQNSSYIDEQIGEVESQMKFLQELIQIAMQKFQKCVENIVNLRKQFLEDYIKGLNFDSLKQLLVGLVQSKEAINPDAVGQLKIRLHQFFFELQTNSVDEANNKLHFISDDVNLEIQKLQNLDLLQEKLEKFKNDQKKIVTSIFPQIQIYKQTIMKLFSSDYLIYQGSRDGLNAESFWSKVNNKSNLLIILQSKSQYIFGGYSPCQWKSSLNSFVQDDTKSSFLFSQTHDEIYPIEKNQYAISCRPDYGPTFGGGHDLNILSNFQDGYSKLGYSYKWGSYKNENSTYLFGQSTPNIIECEIYEILFK